MTGGVPSSAVAAASRAKIPAGVSASASPPESSAVMFQRCSAASTRRPSARSGVTSAAVLPSCTASRSATAMASASSSGLAASITSSCRARRRRALRSPGRRPFAATDRSRQRGAALPRPAARARAVLPAVTTASRPMPMRASKRLHGELRMAGRRRRSPVCGGLGAGSSPAISRQDLSSRSVSSPGSTTAPCGSRAMVAMSSAVDGIEPVEPAAITGASVLRASRCASALISASRRFAGSMRFRVLQNLPATPRARSARIAA